VSALFNGPEKLAAASSDHSRFGPNTIAMLLFDILRVRMGGVYVVCVCLCVRVGGGGGGHNTHTHTHTHTHNSKHASHKTHLFASSCLATSARNVIKRFTTAKFLSGSLRRIL
jgi:hypothetical protein